MVQLRGGTGHKRGDVYGGKLSTRPDSASQPDASKSSTRPVSYAKSVKGPVAVGALFPKLTKQIFEHYGFSTAQLIAEWPAIVGPVLAECTFPEKLKWPHGSPTFLEETDSGQSGATLVLRAEGPRSLEVQFGSSQIIERINQYFGYRAVTSLRIIQAPVPKKDGPKQSPKPVDVSDLTKDVIKIKDPALREALLQMAQGVKKVSKKETNR